MLTKVIFYDIILAFQIKDDILENEIHDWYVSRIYYDPHVCINYTTKEEENE